MQTSFPSIFFGKWEGDVYFNYGSWHSASSPFSGFCFVKPVAFFPKNLQKKPSIGKFFNWVHEPLKIFFRRGEQSQRENWWTETRREKLNDRELAGHLATAKFTSFSSRSSGTEPQKKLFRGNYLLFIILEKVPISFTKYSVCSLHLKGER